MNVKLDFHVFTNDDPRYLIVMDLSEWGYIENKPSIIEIKVPGYRKPVIHYFEKNARNVFNSSNLNMGCHPCDADTTCPLPDGIYAITLKGSPDSHCISRYYFKYDQIQDKLDQMLLGIYGSSCDNKVDTTNFLSLKVLLETVKSAIRQGKLNTAFAALKELQNKLNKDEHCNY